MPPAVQVPRVQPEGPTDIALHVIGCRLTPETSVHNALDDADVVRNICQVRISPP